MDRRAVLAGGLLAAAGWVVRPRAQAAALQPGLEILEPIYAVSATPQGLALRVASKGCAAKADFTFYLDRKPGAVSVAFARKRLETCKPAAGRGGHADLVFTYAELGVGAETPLLVLNPIAPQPVAKPGAPPGRQAPHGRRKARAKPRSRRLTPG